MLDSGSHGQFSISIFVSLPTDWLTFLRGKQWEMKHFKPKFIGSCDTQSILKQHLGWHLIDTSVKSQLIFADMPLSVDRYIWVGRHSTDFWPAVKWVWIQCWSRRWSSVNWVSAKYRSRCPSSVDWDVNWVSIRGTIDTWQQMPSVHMIQLIISLHVECHCQHEKGICCSLVILR